MARRPAAKPVEPISRQAVVVVHGQGQQRPMGTIRDFVAALWTSNPDVTADPPYDKQNTWIVPDDKSGLYEMQRITTPPHDSGRRTDFFELYYADLLADTPIRNLWRWLERLFWISPLQVPRRMYGPWLAFWLLCLVAMAMTLWVILEIPQLLQANWLAPFQDRDRLDALIGLAIITIAVLTLVVPKFFPATEQAKSIPRGAILLALIVGVGFISWQTPVIVAALIVGVVIYLFANDLLPLFGDAASYLSAQTETVRSRQALRERGLSLLKALHDDPEYDRIVVVAHSLGTVLAYDLLQLLWHSVGPTKDNAPAADAVAAIEAVERFASKPVAAWTAADIETYQQLQWQAFSALRRQKPTTPAAGGNPIGLSGWKISDFVTLGSPLANAQFLITEGLEDFERMKHERVLPISPPEPRGDDEGFIYEENGRMVTHHAAVFCTVRWTNIYDEFNPRWFLSGDVISGAVAGSFGPGIRDINVPIVDDGKRRFSHNLYWVDTRSEPLRQQVDAPDGAHTVRAEAAAPQIQHLRDAVGISRS
ncbi:hypothetical protein [Devosia sp.]|uniref:hypothetical protein n=1 Tax=Devosia sp. TaxID=1871048 RepID=UPI003F726302